MAVIELVKSQKYKIVIDYDWNGKKRLRHTETFWGGKKDAQIRAAQIKQGFKTGSMLPKNKMTVQELSIEYLKKQKNLLAPSTYTNYEYRIKNINEKLGHVKLINLNARMIENFYDYLYSEYKTKKGKNLSKTTVQHYYMILNNMLNQAIKWDYLTTNPNSKCTKPQRERNNIITYSVDEVHQLLTAIEKEPLKYRIIVYMLLDAGCRRGELTGLKWSNILLDEGIILINKTTQYVKGIGIVEKETKTRNSDRRVYLSETTVKLLKHYKVEQDKNRLKLGRKWENSGYVLTTDTGGPMHPDTPTKIFKKLLNKYGLKEIPLRNLRHSSLSLLIHEGIQPQIISRKAEHSSVLVTDLYYSNIYPDEFKKAANAMNNILSNH